MPVVLGSEFLIEEPEPLDPPPGTNELLEAVEGLKDALNNIPTPRVQVDPPDLSEIVMAVNGLKPGAGAEEIAEAIAKRLQFPQVEPDVELREVLSKLADKMDTLDFRLKGQSFGGGGTIAGLTDYATATKQEALFTTISELNSRTPTLRGTWSYQAGTSGTENITGRVISISVHATTAGTLTINGGDSIPIPANVSFSVQPLGNLVDPTLVFTGTDSFFCEILDA